MKIINPTGLGLREDSGGSGRFGSPRGQRKHKGIDLLCEPGQVVLAPTFGRIVRAFPYADDTKYVGCRIFNDQYMSKLFYFVPYEDLIMDDVQAGQEIGIAQDISQKYGGGMRAHIHLELWKLNPTILLNPELYIDAKGISELRNGGY